MGRGSNGAIVAYPLRSETILLAEEDGVRFRLATGFETLRDFEGNPCGLDTFEIDEEAIIVETLDGQFIGNLIYWPRIPTFKNGNSEFDLATHVDHAWIDHDHRGRRLFTRMVQLLADRHPHRLRWELGTSASAERVLARANDEHGLNDQPSHPAEAL